MKPVLLLILINWLLWSPAVVLWLFSGIPTIKQNSNRLAAAYVSLLLTGWLLFQARLAATIVFCIAATACAVWAWRRRHLDHA